MLALSRIVKQVGACLAMAATALGRRHIVNVNDGGLQTERKLYL